MARYSAEGARVILVCATRGEEGDILNPRMDRPGIKERMAEVREQELEAACALLGVHKIYQLGYRDSGMPGSDANAHPDAFTNASRDEVIARLLEIISIERPQVFLCYDEHKGYEHPDHVRVHQWGTEVWHVARERAGSGSFPAPQKLYYFATFTRERLSVLHEASVAEGIESPYAGWLDHWDEIGFAEPEITTRVDVAEYVHLRSQALLAHATQIDPDSFWLAIPDDVQRRIYPWEDYQLVESTVPTELPETDLFAGIEMQ